MSFDRDEQKQRRNKRLQRRKDDKNRRGNKHWN